MILPHVACSDNCMNPWSSDLVCVLYLDQPIVDPDSAVILIQLFGLISPSTAVQESTPVTLIGVAR